jgi:GMP synthase (glutamine-hydrolysing)
MPSSSMSPSILKYIDLDCGPMPSFDPQKFIAEKSDEIKRQIPGKAKAVIAVSGGVDSTTAAVLVHQAIGAKLTSVMVDTGFMRKGEIASNETMLKALGLHLTVVDASDEFYNALKGITEPERKRKIIGEKFIRVFERVAKDVGACYLVQGTIAPDWIESGGGLRDTIKSHHNVGGLPKDMEMTLVEPLRDLYKDEVRAVARALKVPVAERQPFPGPGLAVRIMGEATKERAEIVREACAIVEEELEKAAKDGKMEIPWQYFAVLLPIKSVGVHGDVRAYGETLVVRAVASQDAMSAAYSKVPHDVLERISVRITNSLGKKVVRVVYDITNKPPGTIEWE